MFASSPSNDDDRNMVISLTLPVGFVGEVVK